MNPLIITHPYVSNKADGVDTNKVKPSNWNAIHSISGIDGINFLTDTEFTALVSGGSGDTYHTHNHNSSSNIQGGSGDEFYHLNLPELNAVQTITTGSSAGNDYHTHTPNDHNALDGIQGGSLSGSEFYHQTLSQNFLAEKSYGELYENSAGTSINIVSAGTYYKWSSASVGVTKGSSYVVGSSATDDLTIGSLGAGTYKVSYDTSIELQENSCIAGAIFKNDTKLVNTEIRQTSSSAPVIVASSLLVTTGTPISGTIADIQTFNGIFYEVAEVTGVPGFEIELSFIDTEKKASIFEFIGRYNGSAIHIVKIRAFNVTSQTWVDVSSETDDLPSYEYLDYVKRFKIIPAIADFYDTSGTIKIMIIHNTSGTAGHEFYIDRAAMVRDVTAVQLHGSGLISLVENDKIDLRFTCPINGKTITVRTANINITRIG